MASRSSPSVRTCTGRAHRALDALGDATRRSILEALGEGPSAVHEIAAALPVTRPAVSQHLRVLSEAGLVSSVRHGTRRIYALDADGLGAVRSWLAGLSAPTKPSAQAERSSGT